MTSVFIIKGGGNLNQRLCSILYRETNESHRACPTVLLFVYLVLIAICQRVLLLYGRFVLKVTPEESLLNVQNGKGSSPEEHYSLSELHGNRPIIDI